MKYTKVNINNIPIEQAHGGSGSRQVLALAEQLKSPYFEAFTKGFLEPRKIFDWHSHTDIDEIFIVIKGNGKFYWEEESVEYSEGDIITIPASSKHKIEALGSIVNEFFFIRIKVK